MPKYGSAFSKLNLDTCHLLDSVQRCGTLHPSESTGITVAYGTDTSVRVHRDLHPWKSPLCPGLHCYVPTMQQWCEGPWGGQWSEGRLEGDTQA